MVQKITEFHTVIKEINFEKDLKKYPNIGARLIENKIADNKNIFDCNSITIPKKIEALNNFEKYFAEIENNDYKKSAFLRSMFCTAIVAGAVFTVILSGGTSPLIFGLTVGSLLLVLISSMASAAKSGFNIFKNRLDEPTPDEALRTTIHIYTLFLIGGIFAPLVEIFCRKIILEEDYKTKAKDLEKDISELKDFLDKHYNETVEYTEKTINNLEASLAEPSKLQTKEEIASAERKKKLWGEFLSDLVYLKEKMDEYSSKTQVLNNP